MKNNLTKQFFILLLCSLFTVTCNDDNFNDLVPDTATAIIRSFSINGKFATIDHTNATITMTMDAGTDMTSLTPEIKLPEGTTVTPSSGTAQNFSKGSVIYKTTAQNGAKREYTVTLAAYGDPKFLSFSIAGKAGTIDNVNRKITLEIGSQDGNLSSLSPNFTIADGTSVDIASGVGRDFTNPVKYIITSNDGYSAKEYTVIVKQIEAPKILSFKIDGKIGTINENDGTINVEVSAGSNLQSLTPDIQLPNGQSITPSSGVAQNFTNSVIYTVKNTENLTKKYVVNVTKTAFSGTKYAFFGEQSSISNLVDDDAKKAASWMQQTYGANFVYIPFNQISSTTLADVKVGMLYYLTSKENVGYTATSTNVSTMLPVGFREGQNQANAIKEWIKSGGRMLVAGDPNPIIFSINRVPANFTSPRSPGNYVYSEFGCAGSVGCVETHNTDDIWGLGVRTSNVAGNIQGHPIFDGLTITDGNYVALNNSTSREVRLVWWQHFDNILNPSCCGQDAAVKFEKVLNAQKFGTLRHIGDTFGYAAVLWKRTDMNTDSEMDKNISNDYKGTIFSIENTITGYEWDSNGTTNDYQNNIKVLTKNILDYLYQL